jgi:hypothetical protein
MKPKLKLTVIHLLIKNVQNKHIFGMQSEPI